MKLSLSLSVKIKSIQIIFDVLLIPLIIVIMVKNYLFQYLITLCFITAHEMGHIAAALISGARPYSVRILPVGLNAVIDDSRCSRRSRIFIYAAGPCVNMLIAIIICIICFCRYTSGELVLAAAINLWLAVFNMLPVPPMDGSKILMELLAVRFGLFRARKQLYVFSIIFSLIIIIAGILVFKQTLYNVSLVLIGIYILISIKEYRGETALMNIKNFVFRRSRIIRKGICPARVIVVMKNTKLSDVIKAIDYTDMFHLINVLDEGMHVVKIITEQEILDAVLVNGIDITIDKLLTMSEK